jgi:hypothetical protein
MRRLLHEHSTIRSSNFGDGAAFKVLAMKPSRPELVDESHSRELKLPWHYLLCNLVKLIC